ncbi:MAG: hypothetical protein OXU81_21525 [Gammaproteobacteria bacterium]|nr:hypothetical protein [Gammaproteobacteria bacterium]
MQLAGEDKGYTTEVRRRGSRYRYQWLHQGRSREIGVSLNPAHFIQSKAIRNLTKNYHHRHGASEYIEMAERDPYRKSFLSPVVEAIASTAAKDREDPLFMLLTFVQGLPYLEERSGYQAWPTETLINMEGDCSDTAVLYAALLEQYQAKRVALVGRKPLWVFLRGKCDRNHLAVGVRSHTGRRYSGTYYEKSGAKWFVAETTGTGWGIGGDNCLELATVIVPRYWG